MVQFLLGEIFSIPVGHNPILVYFLRIISPTVNSGLESLSQGNFVLMIRSAKPQENIIIIYKMVRAAKLSNDGSNPSPIYPNFYRFTSSADFGSFTVMPTAPPVP